MLVALGGSDHIERRKKPVDGQHRNQHDRTDRETLKQVEESVGDFGNQRGSLPDHQYGNDESDALEYTRLLKCIIP